MNRSGLSAYSLSIVMRSYFMEHEIARGMTKLYLDQFSVCRFSVFRF